MKEQLDEELEKRFGKSFGERTEEDDKKSEDSLTRREFLKKTGLGAAGLSAMALIPSVSAFNIRTSNPLQYFNSSNPSEPNFKVNQTGDIDAGNANLAEIVANQVTAENKLKIPAKQSAEKNQEIWVDTANQKLKTRYNGTTYKADLTSTEIPKSVVHQWNANIYSDPWSDTVGNADMSVTGLSSSTFSNGEDSVSSDGQDDYGKASVENLGSKETFGFAMTWQASNLPDSSRVVYFGSYDTVNGSTGNISSINNGINDGGTITLNLRDDNGNASIVHTDNEYDDGSPHAIVINKKSDNTSDWEIYVDDMSSTVSTTVDRDQGFNHSNYVDQLDPYFFTENKDGSGRDYAPFKAGVFEINNQPYTQQEREDFVSRRPEV